DYNKNRSNKAPSRSYLEKRLGMTWTQILKSLGFKPNVKRFADGELLQQLKELASKLGRTPTTMEARSAGLNISLYDTRFGGFNKALELIGLNKNFEKTNVTHTDKELLEMYKDLCNCLGRVATSKDIAKYLDYISSVFGTRFGVINALR